MRSLTDDELLLMIDGADRQLHAQGYSLSGRQLRCVVDVCTALGITYSIGRTEDPFISRLHELSRNFFRPKDGGAPSVFTGLMTHLGFVFQVHVPIVFGHVSLNPFEHTDATEWQLRRLYRVSGEFEVCFGQVCDIWDIGTQLAPMDGKDRLSGRVGEFFDLSAFHLTAAVSTVSQRSANRGAAQSSLISAELAIKALHLDNGRSEQWIKKNISHDLSAGIDDLALRLGADFDSVSKSVRRLPPLVAERYGGIEVQALRVGELVVLSQSILGAAARSLCGFGYKQKFQTNN